MGTNAYFSYGVVGAMGIAWPTALGAVFISGVLFLALSVTGIRQKVIDGIPNSLKHAMAAGIGVFIAFVGLSNAGVVVDHPVVLVQLGEVTSPRLVVFGVGLLATTILFAWRVQGALLIGIGLATALGVALGLSQLPDGLMAAPPSLAPTFLAMDLRGALQLGLIEVLFAFFFVDLFDSVATLVAVSEHGGLMDPKNGATPPSETSAQRRRCGNHGRRPFRDVDRHRLYRVELGHFRRRADRAHGGRGGAVLPGGASLLPRHQRRAAGSYRACPRAGCGFDAEGSHPDRL